MSMCRFFSCVVGRGCLLWQVHSLGKTLLAIHTHTHTHTYIYIYIYIYTHTEKERENEIAKNSVCSIVGTTNLTLRSRQQVRIQKCVSHHLNTTQAFAIQELRTLIPFWLIKASTWVWWHLRPGSIGYWRTQLVPLGRTKVLLKTIFLSPQVL